MQTQHCVVEKGKLDGLDSFEKDVVVLKRWTLFRATLIPSMPSRAGVGGITSVRRTVSPSAFGGKTRSRPLVSKCASSGSVSAKSRVDPEESPETPWKSDKPCSRRSRDMSSNQLQGLNGIVYRFPAGYGNREEDCDWNSDNMWRYVHSVHGSLPTKFTLRLQLSTLH